MKASTGLAFKASQGSNCHKMPTFTYINTHTHTDAHRANINFPTDMHLASNRWQKKGKWGKKKRNARKVRSNYNENRNPEQHLVDNKAIITKIMITIIRG